MLVHGGAWAIPDDAVEAHLQGVRAAAAAGFDSVADAAEAALTRSKPPSCTMEDDETFDAGRGSFLNMDGRVQLDACMMDGATLRAGGVGCVEHIRNPDPRGQEDPGRQSARLLCWKRRRTVRPGARPRPLRQR